MLQYMVRSLVQSIYSQFLLKLFFSDIGIKFITSEVYTDFLQLNVTWKHNISDSRSKLFKQWLHIF